MEEHRLVLTHLFGNDTQSWTRAQVLLNERVDDLLHEARAAGGLERYEIAEAVASLVEEYGDTNTSSVRDGNIQGPGSENVDGEVVTVSAMRDFQQESGTNSARDTPPFPAGLTRKQVLHARGTLCNLIHNNNIKRVARGQKALEYSGVMAWRGMGGLHGHEFDLLFDNIYRQVNLSNMLIRLDDVAVTADVKTFCHRWVLDSWNSEVQTDYGIALAEQCQKVLKTLDNRSMNITQERSTETDDSRIRQDGSPAILPRLGSPSSPSQDSFSQAFESPLAPFPSRDMSAQPNPSKRRALSPLNEVSTSKERKTMHQPRSAPYTGQNTPSSAHEHSFTRDNSNTSKVAIRLDPEGGRKNDSRWIWWTPEQSKETFYQKISDAFKGRHVRDVVVRIDEKRFVVEPSGLDEEWEIMAEAMVDRNRQEVSALVHLV